MEFSTEDRVVTLYNYLPDTKEFTHSFEYFWNKGTGIAANSTLTQPPAQTKEGFAKVFNGESWDYVEDHRGKTVYATANQKLTKVVKTLGPVEFGFTSSQPASEYTTWNGSEWLDERTHEQIITDTAKALPALTRRQFKLALLENNLLATIDTAINNISDPFLKARIEIEYTEATEFVRTSESVKYMLSILELTEEQANVMWEAAQAL